MANSYVCAQCGWQEINHLHGWWFLEEGEKEDVNRVLPQFSVSLADCMDYVRSEEEVASDKAAEEGEQRRMELFNPGWMA